MKPKPSPIPVHCAHDRLVLPGELKAHPKNPNRHEDRQIRALAAVIKANGWRRSVVVSNLSGYIVAGHGAVEAAKLLNCPVPVNDQAFASEADEHAHMIADNRIAELSEIDSKALAELIRELDSSVQPDALGFNRDEINSMLAELSESVPLKTVEIKPPPRMAWTLIGIPLVRFGEISKTVEGIAKIDGVICEQTVNDEERETEKL
jgi:ParB-like chromosome segregation protein Spo0J